MDKTLYEKVKKFTIACDRDENIRAEPTEIIIVPTGGDLSRGFELCQELLGQNLSVRLIGEGVTLEWAQPSWAREAQRLRLTELGAYHTEKLKKTDWLLQEDVKTWLDNLTGEVVAKISSGKIFLSSAYNRLFASNDNAGSLPVLYAIAEFHGAKNYYYLPGPQSNAKHFEHIVAAFGGTFKGVKSARPFAARLRVLAHGFIMMAAVTLRETYYYGKEAPSRKKLRELREQSNLGSECPLFWVALFADHKRMNSLTIDSFVLPALKSGKPVGILLGGRLFFGETFKLESRERTGNQSWSGLEDIEDRLSKCRVEQIASADTPLELLKTIVRFWAKAGRAVNRVATRPTFAGRTFKFDFSEDVFELLKLVTQDVFQAMCAAAATAKVVSRHDFQGATVPFAISGGPVFSTADVMLQNAGATTIDAVHGINGIWLGMITSQSSIREVRIKPNTETEASPQQKIVVAEFHPPRGEKRKPNRDKARNILILSNYAYYIPAYNDTIPWLPFQEELLSVVPLIRNRFPDRFKFRWRPHPVDWQPAVRKTIERVGGVELSAGHSLDDDLDWADIAVSSFSSVLGEALWSDIPVFLHTPPMSSDVPATLCFDASRRFFHSAEILPAFVDCIESLDRADPRVLDFEKRTRRAWFGAAEDESPDVV